MSLLTQPKQDSTLLRDVPNMEISKDRADELKISSISAREETSVVSDHLKVRKRGNALELIELFNKTHQEKEEFLVGRSESNSGLESTVEGLSKLAFHSDLLKAEKRVKAIKHMKSLKVEVID